MAKKPTFLMSLAVTALLLQGVSAQSPVDPSKPSQPVEPVPTIPVVPVAPKPAEQPATPLTDPTTPGKKSIFDEPLNLKPTMQLRGRIEVEAVSSAQSQQSIDTIGNLQNGFGFRRVRLGAQGTIGDSSSWVSEVELAGGNVRLRDVFVGLDAIPYVSQIRTGHFREPYSLEGMTSSNFMTFLERSSINVLAPARNWGVCAYWWPDDQRMLFSTGVFRDGTPGSGQSLGDGNNWAYTTRFTSLPVYEEGPTFRLIHIGGAFSQRYPPNGIITFTPRNSSNLVTVEDNPGSPFLPSVDIAANSYQLYNLQAAAVNGSFSVQAEWNAAMVQQTNAGGIFVNGAYIASSYFITGEHRSYNKTRGSFDRIDVLRPVIKDKGDPRGGYGAIEFTARASILDFASANLPLDSAGKPVGTMLYDITLGTNWYLNSNTRIMFNYTASIPDKIGYGASVANIFGLRTALYW